MTFDVIHGDCLEVMAGMEAGSVDAVVTDPPYGLEFMGKEWDRLWAKRDKSQDLTGKSSSPFLAARVDKYEAGESAQAWHEQWATAAIRVLRPSHYLLAFGGTRTWHRLACALEDAGFEIRDTLMWMYGSGFPKGRACLKPAWEPVILARKPGPMRELGIEECRIPTDADERARMEATASHPNSTGVCHWGGTETGAWTAPASGRWPANLVLDEEAASMVDEAAPVTGASGAKDDRGRNHGFCDGRVSERDDVWGAPRDERSGASRFFYCPKASRAERDDGLFSAAEAEYEHSGARGHTLNGDGTPRPRPRPRANTHPTVKPLSLMRWLVRLVARPGDTVLDPFTGSGTTGVACAKEGRDFIGIEREAEYVEIARRRIEAAAAQTRLPV